MLYPEDWPASCDLEVAASPIYYFTGFHSLLNF